MEKYSRWSDLTTGINPFVPPPHQLPANAILRWTQVFFGGILALLRWILLFPLVLGLVLLSAVHTILDHVPFLGRVIHRATDWIVLGLILVVTTIFIKDEAANARRLGLLTPGTKPPALGGIKAGDVIVANHSSVLDILYFGFRYSPVFVFPCASDASKNLVQTFGLLGAFAQAMAPPLTSLTRPVKLQDVLRRTSSPVVVFPEGTRSNGKAVLTFLPILDSLPPPTRVHLVAIRYESKAISPTHTCGSAGWHLFCRVLSHAYHTVKITTLASEFVPKGSTSQQLQALLASMLRTKAVHLTCADFASFNAYWAHVNGGGRQPASAFTSRKAPHEHAQWKTSDD
ncbi:hypothetical protein H257_11618 [Aphanomyces astaci]|uniref:Phospholipid/glycerol acyltransferase domain-containing protein n=2 Tax=Aphanomyces astaci TaxID=112090 RepID=W4G3H6_APHAT|nr:hypothetical protein H257_11618 [Aphanomyces astaci]ETV73493.1 hypothetical protein H257_11618 [Aphanomyces astaci]|eukprot:XP_009836919.1 hypothetical protein H257_11618 [Aphanomyces astaci]